jgi:UDP:flavonoid glycosyltransferase YjiC (YdhE family)
VPQAVEGALKGNGPTVYLAITSSETDLVRKAVAEVAAAGAQVIVAGTVHDLSGLGGGKIVVGGVLPSHKIMPRVDLAVTAGGQGSVQCAMAAGTPLIGIPLQPEQDCNVHFVEQQGAARRLPMRDVGSGRLTELVKEMLAKPDHRAAARHIQAAYARRDGPRLSAEAIMRFVSGDARKAA